MTERAFYRQLLEDTLPDREEVRRLCLAQWKAEAARERGAERRLPVRQWAAGCLLALLLAAGGAVWSAVLWEPSAGSPSDSGLSAPASPSETAGGGAAAEDSSDSSQGKTVWEDLRFYPLSQMPTWEYSYIALLCDDFVSMSLEELERYFQLPFQPEAALEGYRLEENPEVPYGLFRRSGGEAAGRVYHDLNCLEYRAVGGEGVLQVSFNRAVPDLFRLAEPSAGEARASVLHSARFGELPVTLYRCEEGAVRYCAQFRIGETTYWVQSEAIGQSAFLSLLETLAG